jgi:protein-tyrosine sulfotransferase
MPYPPIFVVSGERSGSTLLRYLLDTHPAIGSPGELCLGGLCAHLHLVVSRTRPSSHPETAVCSDVRRIVSDVMETYLQRAGKRIWCDKTPANVPFLGLLATIFHDARFLCLYRNCRDAAYSCYAGATHGVMAELARYVARHPDNFPVAMVENWVDKNEAITAFERQHASRCMRIRYEDLVTAPDAEMSNVMRFLALDWDPALLRLAFEMPHLAGGGDTKIRDQKSVHTRSIGLGRQMPLAALPPSLAARANALLAQLNYHPLTSVEAPAVAAASSAV